MDKNKFLDEILVKTMSAAKSAQEGAAVVIDVKKEIIEIKKELIELKREASKIVSDHKEKAEITGKMLERVKKAVDTMDTELVSKKDIENFKPVAIATNLTKKLMISSLAGGLFGSIVTIVLMFLLK